MKTGALWAFAPVMSVISISGALEKNPNEGFFILYYYGMSFKGLDDAGVPEPLFCDLAFSKPCIAVNGRKGIQNRTGNGHIPCNSVIKHAAEQQK